MAIELAQETILEMRVARWRELALTHQVFDHREQHREAQKRSQKRSVICRYPVNANCWRRAVGRLRLACGAIKALASAAGSCHRSLRMPQASGGGRP